MNVTIEDMPELRVATVHHVGPYNRISEAFGLEGNHSPSGTTPRTRRPRTCAQISICPSNECSPHSWNEPARRPAHVVRVAAQLA
jgi:hypothetical protein